MVFMGDRATLLETGRFVQRHARNAADEIIEAVTAVDAFADTTARTEPDAGPETEAETEAETEGRHRRAAERGDTDAMSALGALLLRRGDLEGAEPFLRAATAEGDRAAANNLGVLLHQRGYPDEAAGWWRVAAVAGSAPRRARPGPPPAAVLPVPAADRRPEHD
ncbi:tetratricopeptide repeat protein, partial [Streptomyces filamentosus]|uniref:tetratricopeptide repeat protein n=1 Tax=Streptomyces filamentosus TaxID=67294 RepID=UPI00331D3B84